MVEALTMAGSEENVVFWKFLYRDCSWNQSFT